LRAASFDKSAGMVLVKLGQHQFFHRENLCNVRLGFLRKTEMNGLWQISNKFIAN
jgi:hypothetical protein